MTIPAVCLALASPSPDGADLPRVVLPRLPAEARSAAGFAPPGWAVEQSRTGDLNGDGAADLAVVLHAHDPACRIAIAHRSEPLDSNPRILLVAFRKGPAFRLAAQDRTLIPRVDDPYMDDPFVPDDLVIRRGVLHIGLTHFRSAGGWTAFSATFRFRWQRDAFRLIGYDRNEVRRNSGETEQVSVNFVTGRARRAAGSIEDDATQTPCWTRLPPQKELTLGSVGDGLGYRPRLQAMATPCPSAR